MAQVASDSGIFQGISREDLARVAPSLIRLRPGSLQTLAALRTAQFPTRILSISFSASMISAALSGAGNAKSGASGAPFDLTANELEFGPDGTATGRINLRINSAQDKLEFLESALASPSASANKEGQSVYIGDSASDLLCLLRCDIGIVMKSRGDGREPNATLQRVATAAGIDLVPLASFSKTAASRGDGGRRTLFLAESWAEVATFLLPSTANPHVADPSQAPRAVVAPLQAPRVLSIAGSDSGGGAGIQADLKTFEALGAFGMTAVTALTAQNTRGVQAVEATSPDMIRHQIESCLTDIGTDVVKTGMLSNVASVNVVTEALLQHRAAWKHLVIDPVMISTSGHNLAANEAIKAVLDALFPLATLVTPNVPEARAILAVAARAGSIPETDAAPLLAREWSTAEDLLAAAKLIALLGPRAVLVKGGHLSGDQALDVLYEVESAAFREFSAPRLETTSTHGTGCTLASAVSAFLARGLSLPDAVEGAKRYVWQALHRSAHLLIGTGTQRPFNRAHASHDLGLGDAQLAYMRAVKGRTDYLRVYAVTDPYCNEAAGRSMVEAVRQTLEGGATIVQLREKKIDGGDFVKVARDVLALCRAYGVPMVINDRVDVCMAVGADGVHVGQDDIPCALVRKILGPDRILGVSCKTPEQVRKAYEDGADYVGCGGVYATTTKVDNETIHVEGLKRICDTKPLPVVAIGGVKAHNAAPCLQAGADGIAVVSGIFAAADAEAATRELVALVDRELPKEGR